MTAYVALLRAVNVGGTGKLPMADLKRLCVDLGYTNVQTYIASGNVMFQMADSETRIKQQLAASLYNFMGKSVPVMVRSAAEMAAVLEFNPFKQYAGHRVLVSFLDTVPPADTLVSIKGQQDEEIALGAREIYVHYGEGMGKTKLQIPAAMAGTARNMNTVAKLVKMSNASSM
jgi:uncharacterized protein (DUF1697 family)